MFSRLPIGLRTALVLVPIDWCFKLLVTWPVGAMLTFGRPELRSLAFGLMLVGCLPLQLVWIWWFRRVLAPADRWRTAGGADAAVLKTAAETAYAAPSRLTAVFSLHWAVLLLVGLALVRWKTAAYMDLPPGALLAFALAMVTVVIGAAAVCFTMTSWYLGRVTVELSAAARAQGVVVGGTALLLRRRLGLVAFAIGLPPGSWTAALACVEHFSAGSHRPGDAFDMVLPVSLAGIAVFAPLCAWFLAATLADPVARMRAVVADIIRRGDVSQVERLPVQQRDEIGALAEGVNEMIDRLEEVERSRRQIAARLASLNHQLEEQVEQRTKSLEATNDQLRREISERERMEVELRLAQKLEAVGRLASGVAHEINTPVQFVSDSLHFVREAFTDLEPLVQRYRELQVSVQGGTPSVAAAEAAADLAEELELDYVLENIPLALERSVDGLNRVATIVKSMKRFAHPDQQAMTPVDLNEIVRTTLTIASNEYKYVAEVSTELGELPAIAAYGGELGQALLNMIVNATHAIEDVVGATGARGRIAIRTWPEERHVCISVSDTGCGIPEAVRPRIFDPFFTTKEIGRGTGQGLAMVHGVVAKHGGEVRFTTAVGEGTTFTVRLPRAQTGEAAA
jgi:signal transduction histidine kinase/HAMP domain-containing protein